MSWVRVHRPRRPPPFASPHEPEMAALTSACATSALTRALLEGRSSRRRALPGPPAPASASMRGRQEDLRAPERHAQVLQKDAKPGPMRAWLGRARSTVWPLQRIAEVAETRHGTRLVRFGGFATAQTSPARQPRALGSQW